MKRIKFLLPIIVLISFSTLFAGKAYKQDTGADGLVSIEAEHFQQQHPGKDLPWALVPDTLASGGYVMQTPNNNTTIEDPTRCARIDYVINFVQTGKHYLWVRGHAPSSSDDSFFAGLDGAKPNPFFPTRAWEWTNYRSFAVEITSPGLHIVNIYRREDGYMLDKLVLTTSSAYKPANMGPAESPTMDINLPPTIGSVEKTYTFISGNDVAQIPFIGVTDGDDDQAQNLTITARTNSPSIISNLQAGNVDANGNLVLSFVPATAGTGRVDLVIKDNGGTANGAIDSLVVSFDIQVLDRSDAAYTDNFDGALKASASTDFNLQIVNKMLHVRMHTVAQWQGISYQIGKTINMSFQPFMNLKVKTDVPFVLSAYIVDANKKNMLKQAKVYATTNFVNYFFDFSDFAAKGVDASQIVSLIFTPNGASRGLDADNIFFDELKIGLDAEKLANIGGIGDITVYKNSVNQKIPVLDLFNTRNIVLQGGENLISNINISPVVNNLATISFDCQKDVVGQGNLLMTAQGGTGFADNQITVPISIEANAPPKIDPIKNQTVPVGVEQVLTLTGISDGDAAIEQPLLITATSDAPLALPDSNIAIIYEAGSTKALLKYTTQKARNDIHLTITLNDQEPAQNLTQMTFTINTFEGFNNPPTLDKVKDQDVILGAKSYLLKLTGITDGDSGLQTLSFSAKSSNDAVVPNSLLFFNYNPGEKTAVFQYSASQTGNSEITITLKDNGGTAYNNGNQMVEIKFRVFARTLPPKGYEIPFTNYETDKWRVWSVETEGTTMFTSYLDTDKGKALNFQCKNKWIWNGVWFGFSPIDLTEHPYFSMEVKVDDPMYFWMWFWDPDTAYTGSNVGKRNTNFNINDIAPRIQPGTWTRVTFDFSGYGLADDKGTPLWKDQIVAVLLNFHQVFYSNDGTPNYNGNVAIRNLKIGDKAEGIVLKLPLATINPVPDQVIFQNAGTQQITLTGISDGGNGTNTPALNAKSSNTAFIPDPVVTAVNPDGTATLKYIGSSNTGTARITITVSAPGSKDRIIGFNINVISESAENASVIEVNRDKTFQTMHGFGTFSNNETYLNLYTQDLGASAMRLGLIENQIEPVNDNNDPNVLDMSALNYNAFDFNYYRRLKDAGVETFILTSWSPPAWMKRNLTVSYFMASATRWEETDNILEPYYYDEFAESMVAVVRMFKDEAGIDLYAIGVQNEPAFNEPYPSAILSPPKFAEVIKIVGARFEREGIRTKLYMPEQVFSQGFYPMSAYIAAVQNDPDANKYTDIIATHGYANDGIGEAQPKYIDWEIMWNNARKSPYPKELWMTETYPEYSNWNSALSMAGAIHGALYAGNVSLWTLWSIDGTLVQSGTPTASFYTSKNYYKFIRPGAKRIEAKSTSNDLLITAFDHRDNCTITVVVINKGKAPASVLLNGQLLPPAMDIYTTANNQNCEFRGTTSGTNPTALPAQSVTTFIGKYEKPSGVADAGQVPESFKLMQNYPNPFNPTTTIEFQIPEASPVTIRIFDILGREVRMLVNATYSVGAHKVQWDGRNNLGQPVATGLYIYRFESKKYTAVRKSLLLK
ncbi:T9SS type A sorting domain-containing protein [candidate division KSB1 bacterium]|nr:T9SS type A sorting domain-containing protein [candidate division KSB1 bacterium]